MIDSSCSFLYIREFKKQIHSMTNRIFSAFMFFALVLLLTTCSKKISINNKDFREKVLKDYLMGQYEILFISEQETKRAIKPTPYYVGDTFNIKSELSAFVLNVEGGVTFSRENFSKIPEGTLVRIVADTGMVFRIKWKGEENSKKHYIFKETLDDHFFPENATHKILFFKNYLKEEVQLRKLIAKRYSISESELEGILSSELLFNRRNR